jgi:hypothetical protein
MHRSPPEQGRPPLARAVMAASQSMAGMEVPPLVPCSMNLQVKSRRCRKVCARIPGPDKRPGRRNRERPEIPGRIDFSLS